MVDIVDDYGPITLINRLWYLILETAEIKSDYIDLIKNDFNVIRNAGFKAIVRFAYSNKVN